MFGYKLYHPSCWYFFPIYMISKYSGVLPVSIDRQALENTYDEKKTTVFKTSFLSWILFLGWCTLDVKIFTWIYEKSEVAWRKYDSCFDEFCADYICRSVCAHFAIIWVVDLQCALTLLTTLVYRSKKQMRLINKLHDQCNQVQTKFPASLMIATFFHAGVHLTTFWIQWHKTHYGWVFLTQYGPTYLALMTPMASDVLMTSLVTVIESLFKDLNSELTEIGAMDTSAIFGHGVTNRIEALMTRHWKMTKLAADLNRCFQFDFLISTLSFVFRVIYFAFLNLKFLVSAPKHRQSVNIPQPKNIIYFLTLASKFVYLSYRCDLATLESQRTDTKVRRLLLKKEIRYNREANKMIKQFMNQINCQSVYFTACDLFTIDRSLLKKICGVTMTYFIILLQFQTTADE